MDVQLCWDMKPPMNCSTSNLNPSRRVLSETISIGGGLHTDASAITKGAVLSVGGSVDLSAIAFLRCAFFCFCSRVSRGAIIAFLTRLKDKKFIVIICKLIFLDYL